ncbi:unnamed protein product, partial [Amoebophrya sp. A120]
LSLTGRLGNAHLFAASLQHSAHFLLNHGTSSSSPSATISGGTTATSSGPASSTIKGGLT